eukprot:358075-Chlamydomonas_euryale.AAC.2
MQRNAGGHAAHADAHRQRQRTRMHAQSASCRVRPQRQRRRTCKDAKGASCRARPQRKCRRTCVNACKARAVQGRAAAAAPAHVCACEERVVQSRAAGPHLPLDIQHVALAAARDQQPPAVVAEAQALDAALKRCHARAECLAIGQRVERPGVVAVRHRPAVRAPPNAAHRRLERRLVHE